MFYFPILFSFVIIPVLESLAGQSKDHFEENQMSSVFDVIVYLMLPTQYAMLFWFLTLVGGGDLGPFELIGATLSMGLLCGVIGINVAHELGHRVSMTEQTFALLLLCTSLYMHFFIEHNKGHHRNVGTELDPASAQKGESLYRFWGRTVVSSFFSAKNISAKERARKGLAEYSFGNEWFRYMIIQAVFVLAIAIGFGLLALLLFVCAAAIGIVLLETVNYIEHYGLRRKKVSEHRYEDVQAWHSWNSDFVLGRWVLFELTRHSDHHRNPNKHYPYLESMPDALQLPAGYPAMMLLAMWPKMWFKIMDERLPSEIN